jgi:hypothetical protein
MSTEGTYLLVTFVGIERLDNRRGRELEGNTLVRVTKLLEDVEGGGGSIYGTFSADSEQCSIMDFYCDVTRLVTEYKSNWRLQKIDYSGPS